MSSKLRRAANAWSLVFIATVASLYKVADLGRSPSCSPSNFHVVRLTRYSMPMVYQRHGSFCNDDEPNPDQQRASIARRRHRRERWQEPERARIRSAARPHAERAAAGGPPAAGAPAGGCLADIAPVREALAKLESEGLVTRHVGRLLIVREIPVQELMQILQRALDPGGRGRCARRRPH